MPEIKEIFPLNSLPHNEWIDENKEFLSTNKIPTPIQRKIGGIRLTFTRYTDAVKNNDEEKANKYLESCKKSSYEIWDDLQTWKEKDLPDDDAPEPKINNSTDEGVELIDGFPVTAAEKAERQRLADEKAKKDAEDNKANEQPETKSNVGGGLLTLLGIGVAAFLGLKWLGRR